MCLLTHLSLCLPSVHLVPALRVRRPQGAQGHQSGLNVQNLERQGPQAHPSVHLNLEVRVCLLVLADQVVRLWLLYSQYVRNQVVLGNLPHLYFLWGLVTH